MALYMHLKRITAVAVFVGALVAGTALAGGGSPFNGHYVGKSADGKHHVDINVNGGAKLTTNLKLACSGRPGYGDFAYRAVVARDGRVTVTTPGSGSGRPVTLRMTAAIGAGIVRGRLTAQVGSCKVGPVQFAARRQAG